MLRRLELDLVNNDQPTLTESVKTGTIDINTNKISSLCTYICLLLFFWWQFGKFQSCWKIFKIHLYV